MEHGNSGVHAVAVALYQSGGASSMVIGGLPLLMRAPIFGLFDLVYRLVKRYGSFTDLAADAATATMVRGAVAIAYRSPLAAQKIMHSIAAPIRAARGEDITQPLFFALASDSSADRGANKQELVYARTVSMGRSRTFFVGPQDLQAGRATAILVAYVMLRARLAVIQWIDRVFWCCVDEAAVMQSTANEVCGLLVRLQKEVLGYSVLVLVHANCHCADLAFRDAMDSNHAFLNHIADATNAVVKWYRNAPTRLRNLRRLSVSLHMCTVCVTAQQGYHPRSAQSAGVLHINVGGIGYQCVCRCNVRNKKLRPRVGCHSL